MVKHPDESALGGLTCTWAEGGSRPRWRAGRVGKRVAARGARQDELGVDVELVAQLGVPLFGQMRRTEHGRAVDLPTVEEIARDESRLDGLADPHVVGDQKPHQIEPQRQRVGLRPFLRDGA